MDEASRPIAAEARGAKMTEFFGIHADRPVPGRPGLSRCLWWNRLPIADPASLQETLPAHLDYQKSLEAEGRPGVRRARFPTPPERRCPAAV